LVLARRLSLFLFFLSFVFCSIEPDKIIFSNEPESIVEDGSVLDIQVTGSFRLFLSHVNRTNRVGNLYIQITSSEDSKFKTRSALAGPNKSELFVGKVLGERFLITYNNLQESSFPLEWKVRMPTQDVLSGIVDVFPENNQAIYRVQIFFEKPSLIQLDYNQYVFMNKTVSKIIKVSKGDIRHNLMIGAEPGYIDNGHHTLIGNYGVFYEYYIDFSEIGEYQLLFTANGGPASCVFKFGDELFSVYSHADKKIKTVTINRPGIVRFLTFPLPGSNYPTTVTIVKERVYTN